MGIVILGAGGRLGSLLRPIFPGTAQWHCRADVDLTDTPSLTAALRGAHAVFCMAGVTNAQSALMDLNTDVAVRTLDAAAHAGAGRVFVFSSAAVYGNAAGLLPEDSALAPLSPYGRAKVAMENAAAAHAHPSTVLRLGNVAGADAVLNGWQPGFQLDVLPDGDTPWRSYIGPHALARVLHDLAYRAGLPHVLNVASPGCVAMGDLLDAAGLDWIARPASPATIPSVNLDTSCLRAFTEFKPADATPTGIVEDWQKRRA
ncbi:MAG: NAD-dependent epimerase/dehydratase family protein [Pseudomonadota bacterium]